MVSFVGAEAVASTSPGVPDQTPYDVVFIGLSVLVLAAVWALLRRTASRS